MKSTVDNSIMMLGCLVGVCLSLTRFDWVWSPLKEPMSLFLSLYDGTIETLSSDVSEFIQLVRTEY